jgi:hypothetical protein
MQALPGEGYELAVPAWFRAGGCPAYKEWRYRPPHANGSRGASEILEATCDAYGSGGQFVHKN